MKIKDQVQTTMNPGWTAPDRDGDRRDVHEHNPNVSLSAPHEIGKGDPKNDFQEGMNGSHYRGPVTEITQDILSSPMNGPRRASTGERESGLGKAKNVP